MSKSVTEEILWTPVSQQLPDDGEHVIVWNDTLRMPTIAWHNKDAWYDMDGECTSRVTHWTTLEGPTVRRG